VWSFEFGASSLELRVWNFEFGASSLELRVWNFEFGTSSLEPQVFDDKCSVCARGGPVDEAVNNSKSKDTRRELLLTPLSSDEVPSVQEFLEYMGRQSIELGEGSRFTEQAIPVRQRLRLSLLVDHCESFVNPDELVDIYSIVIHAVEQDGNERCGHVTLHAEDGSRFKGFWMERDGEVSASAY
jgi:hypothetical protein